MFDLVTTPIGVIICLLFGMAICVLLFAKHLYIFSQTNRPVIVIAMNPDDPRYSHTKGGYPYFVNIDTDFDKEFVGIIKQDEKTLYQAIWDLDGKLQTLITGDKDLTNGIDMFQEKFDIIGMTLPEVPFLTKWKYIFTSVPSNYSGMSRLSWFHFVLMNRQYIV